MQQCCARNARPGLQYCQSKELSQGCKLETGLSGRNCSMVQLTVLFGTSEAGLQSLRKSLDPHLALMLFLCRFARFTMSQLPACAGG